MAKRQKPAEYEYLGLDLEYCPFDLDAFDDVIKQTGKPLAVSDEAARERLRDAMNRAAIWLDHNIQLARAPSDTSDCTTLKGLLAAVRHLRTFLPVTVARDQGLAPGDELGLPYGIRRLLEDEMAERLAMDTPIPDWCRTVLGTPNTGPKAETYGSIPLSWQELDLGDVTYVQLDDDVLPTSPARPSTRNLPAPGYDPTSPATFFGADEAEDILVNLSKSLALLEASANAAQAKLDNVSRAKRETPERTFVYALIPIYRELFGAEPGMSVAGRHTKRGAYDDGAKGGRSRPGGPLLRFLSACLAHTADRHPNTIEPETLRKYVRAYKRSL